MTDNHIDWNDFHYAHFPRKDQPDRMELVYAVYCPNPNCGRKRYLRKNDALRAAQCGLCQRRDAASKLPLADRLKHIGANHLANPSVLEQLLINCFDTLNNSGAGIDYRREQVITGADGHPYLVDFVLKTRGQKRQVIIEVDGDWVHAQPGRKEFGQRKDKALRDAGYIVHRLGESQVKTAVDNFIGQIVMPDLWGTKA